MPQNNYALAVRLQQAAIEQARAIQGLNQSAQSFPLAQQQRSLGVQRTSQQISQGDQSFPYQQQKLTLGNQRAAQEISQASESFPLQQQKALQELSQNGANFQLQQQAGLLAQENGIASQYGAENTGEILNTLARRNLTRDPTTQQLAEAKNGDAVWAPNSLSFYVQPKFVPGQNGMPGTTTPGRFAQITEQDAHSLLDSANARVAAQKQAMMQSQFGSPDAASPAGYTQGARQNTGWGIFGEEGNSGDYHTDYLKDESNAAGMTPQGYLSSILAKQMRGGSVPGGASVPGGFQMPPNPHDEFAALSQQRQQAMGGAPAQGEPFAPGSASDPLRMSQDDVATNAALTPMGAASPFGLYLANRMAMQSPQQTQQDSMTAPPAPSSGAAMGQSFRAVTPGIIGAGLDAAYYGARQAAIRGENALKYGGNFLYGAAGNDQDYFTPQAPTPSSLPNPLTWMLHRMGIGQ